MKFKLPLVFDDYDVYMWDSNHKPVFNWLTGDEALIGEIKEILQDPSKKLGSMYKVTRDDERIYINDVPILLVRGWGFLTGIGGLRLSSKEAIKAQDEIIDYVIEKLKGE